MEKHTDCELKAYFKNKKNEALNDRITLKVIVDVDILVYDEKRLVIPAKLQSKVVMWYHHYLMHPGHTRLEETLVATMYWQTLRSDVRRHVEKCDTCQKGKIRKQKYGKIPPKKAITVLWQCVCAST